MPRKKGSENKIPKEIKDMIQAALNRVGGVHYLVKQAHDNPTAFMGLLKAVLPKDINATMNGNITVMETIKKDGKEITYKIGEQVEERVH